jgi:flagellar motility protein MotE (MotC chaperone)
MKVHPMKLRLLPLGAVGLLATLAVTGPAQGQDRDASADAASASQPRGNPNSSRGLQRLASELNARDRAIARRERTIAQRETDLTAAEETLAARIEELAALRAQLEETLGKAEDLQDARLTGLVKMTEKMREKQAAAVLSEVEDELAVKVLDRMNRAKAGKALAAMAPQKAATLAEKLTRPIDLGAR